MNDGLKLARIGKGVYNRFGAAGKTVGAEICIGGAEGYENHLVIACCGTKGTIVVTCVGEFFKEYNFGIREFLLNFFGNIIFAA